MAMVDLSAALRRDAGKEKNRKRLARGLVPGVIYGKNLPTRMLEFERKEIEKFFASARRGTVVVRLAIRDGEGAKETYAVLKEAQTDPRTDRVIHVDFYEVAQGQTFRIEVPLRVVGKAKGVEDGGILETVVRSLEVLCTPDCVPEFIEADVSSLSIGDVLHLGDVKFPEGVSPVEKDRKMTIASVHAPRVEEVVTVTPEEAAEGASVAEGEGKEKEREKGKEKEKE